MHLLTTLGFSFGVVPEAFLMGNGDECYETVTVLATSGVSESVALVRSWFRDHAPEVALRIFIIADLPDIKDLDDHARYEEALFRVYFDCTRRAGGPENLHLSLAGGFKTISSAAHQTADLLGCGKLFHLTTASGEKFQDDQSIRQGIAEKNINLIDLGPRPGWPTLQALAAGAPALPPDSDSLVIADTDTPLRDQIFLRLRQANDLARSQHELATLPFPVLATWTPAQRDWLEAPLDPSSPDDQAWVKALPKVELHCHLGGFATHGDLLHEVRAAAHHPEKLPPLDDSCDPPSHWPTPPEAIGLERYRKLGDQNGSTLLRDPGCLKKHLELLSQHLQEQHIQHAEIRCSPGNYASPELGRSPWTVLTEIIEHFGKMTASTKLAKSGRVAASVPLAESGSSSVSDEDHQFLPFQPDAPFTQTWRDLPHRHQSGATVYVTFRLHDSLPGARLKKWLAERADFLATHPKPWDETTWKKYQRRFPNILEDWLDEAHGSCLLREPENAQIVAQALHHFDGQRYLLDDYVVMPNHVHVLFKPLAGHSLSKILHSWKSYTSHQINHDGQLWQEESFDHLVRSVSQLERFRRYIRANPEKAGLSSGFVLGRGLSLVTGNLAHHSTGGTPADPPESSQRLAPTIKLIVIATRQDGGDFRTRISSHLALAAAAASHWTDPHQPQVVGVDLAGYESPATRAHYFREEFTTAHRAGLGITIHAGENDDAEGIWSAILDLNARRLGHALHLADSPTLLETVAQRRVAVEMCPFANYQIIGFPIDDDVESALARDRYPLKNYLDHNIAVTVNTDNIGISAASLSDNLLFAARLCPGLTRLDVLRLIRHAADAAFGPASLRQNLIERIQRALPAPPNKTWQQASRLLSPGPIRPGWPSSPTTGKRDAHHPD